MFSAIKKKLQGVLTEAAVRKKSDAYFGQLLKNTENKIVRTIDNNNMRENWRNWHNDFCSRIPKANSRYEQIIELRKATLSQIEEISKATPFVNDSFDEEDKKILAEITDKDLSYEDVKKKYLYRYMFAQTSWQIFRLISYEFDDASAHDWTEWYQYIFDQYIEHTYRRAIKEKKQQLEDGALDELENGLINTYRKKCEEVKQGIFEGSNYEFDRAAEEREQREEKEKEERKDEEQKREEEAKRIAKKTITNSEIQDLTDFMLERYQRIRNGELYKVEDYSPENAWGAIEVDSGVMLIALSECVAEIETAKDGLRKIMWGFAKAIGNEKDLDGKNIEDVNIGVAEVIFNMSKENFEGWWPNVVLMAVQYLYGINFSDCTDKEKEEIGRLAAPMLDDTWNVFANTKNVFGYRINTEKIFKNENLQETAAESINEKKIATNYGADCIFESQNGAILTWSKNPGAFELHLFRRNNNFFFKKERRIVTQNDIDNAIAHDSFDSTQLERHFHELLGKIQNDFADKTTWGEINEVRKRIDSLIELALGIGGSTSHIKGKLKELRQSLILSARQSFAEDVENLRLIDEAEVLVESNAANFSIPFIAQMLRKDGPIPDDEIIPSLLMEEPAIIKTAINFMNTDLHFTIRKEALTILDDAIKEGASIENHEMIIDALGNASETQ